MIRGQAIKRNGRRHRPHARQSGFGRSWNGRLAQPGALIRLIEAERNRIRAGVRDFACSALSFAEPASASAESALATSPPFWSAETRAFLNRPPSDDIGDDGFICFKVTPLVIVPTTDKRDGVSAVLVPAEELDRRLVRRQGVSLKFGNSVLEH